MKCQYIKCLRKYQIVNIVHLLSESDILYKPFHFGMVDFHIDNNVTQYFLYRIIRKRFGLKLNVMTILMTDLGLNTLKYSRFLNKN